MSEGVGDAEAFKALERAGWGAKVETYGRLTGQITARLVEPLLDAAGVAAGMGVLDVGTGPGYAAQRAAQRGAVATGVDIADEVLALARRRHRGIRFLRADAEDLPFAERSFDALVGNFAINHLPRPERAIREFARVVVPGAWIALSAWDVPERSRFPGLMVDALGACGVTHPQEAPAGPDPYRFADNDEFRGLLRGAGLQDVEVHSVSLTHQVPDADELWQGMLGGSVRTAGLVMRQPPPTRTRVRAAVERLAEEYRGEGGLAIPACAKIARGRLP
ncbi:MAG: class I SAM-dependent methyltransferase [Actinomycetota bacterium]